MSLIEDNAIEVRTTPLFDRWFGRLADRIAKRAVLARIVRMQSGLFGDAKTIGQNVSEIRIDVGPGYRLYFTRTDHLVVLLLCGGDKSSQQRDIRRAQAMVAEQ